MQESHEGGDGAAGAAAKETLRNDKALNLAQPSVESVDNARKGEKNGA